MPAYYYQPELLRVKAESLRLAGREAEARQLLLASISTARQHGSWALAIRSANALARAASTDRVADLMLLRDLYQRLPLDNDTDYGREARALLSINA